jgi:hypothetical protein
MSKMEFLDKNVQLEYISDIITNVLRLNGYDEIFVDVETNSKDYGDRLFRITASKKVILGNSKTRQPPIKFQIRGKSDHFLVAYQWQDDFSDVVDSVIFGWIGVGLEAIRTIRRKKLGKKYWKLITKEINSISNKNDEKIKAIVEKLDLNELLQLSLDLVRKEPKLRVIGSSGGNWGEYTQIFEPLRKRHFFDLLKNSVLNHQITYEQLQDYMIHHALVPRDYFPERIKQNTDDIVIGFAKSVKIESLKKHDTKCSRCLRFYPPFLFDHKDENQKNNSPDNCIPLCPDCYKRKHRIPN